MILTQLSKLSDSEIYLCELLSKIFSSLSVACAILIILIYGLVKEIRSYFKFELILYLIIANMSNDLTQLLPSSFLINSNGHITDWCKAQAFLTTTFSNSSLICGAIIGYSCFISVVKPEHIVDHQVLYRTLFISTAVILPALLALMLVYILLKLVLLLLTQPMSLGVGAGLIHNQLNNFQKG